MPLRRPHSLSRLEDDAAPVTTNARRHAKRSPHDRQAVLVQWLSSESGIGPACEFGRCKLQVRVGHESAPDTSLDSAETVAGYNRHIPPSVMAGVALEATAFLTKTPSAYRRITP
jgi:hypothetical protein